MFQGFLTGWHLRSPVFLAAISFSILCLAGCTEKRSPEEMKDTLVFGYGDNFKTFDPARQIYAQETAIIQQVLEPLAKFNQDLELEPCLAVSWETPDDCNSWVFHLRPNVKFHDDTPFTSEAVKYHFERLLDPATASSRRKLLEHIDTIETPDDLTVIFRMKLADCVFPETISGTLGSIVSPTAMKQRGTEFARNPVGTGPFIFVDWVPDVHIKLRKNHAHWAADEYLIERLEFRPVRENTTRLILLEQGVLDIASIYFAQVNVARANKDMVVQSVPQLSIIYIGFNVQKPPFSDVRVRQAANYAVDKKTMIKYMFFGAGEPARGPLPSVLPAFSDNVQDYPYDPEKARQLLAEAGYPNGIDVEFWTPESGTYWKTTEGAVESLRKIGINANVKIMDNAVYWDKFDEYLLTDGTAYPTKEGVYDIYVGGWVGGETAHGYLEPLFKGRSYSNASFYDNPEVNALIAEYKKIPDPARRIEVAQRIQEIVTREAPWIFAMHGQINHGVRHRVKGYRVNPASNYYFQGVSVTDEE